LRPSPKGQNGASQSPTPLPPSLKGHAGGTTPSHTRLPPSSNGQNGAGISLPPLPPSPKVHVGATLFPTPSLPSPEGQDGTRASASPAPLPPSPKVHIGATLFSTPLLPSPKGQDVASASASITPLPPQPSGQDEPTSSNPIDTLTAAERQFGSTSAKILSATKSPKHGAQECVPSSYRKVSEGVQGLTSCQGPAKPSRLSSGPASVQRFYGTAKIEGPSQAGREGLYPSSMAQGLTPSPM
jgi:hypothetical protein